MTRDRYIQLVTLALFVVFVGAAATLMPHISQQRQDLQLDLGGQMGKSAPPGVVLANAALGSFRGLLVDVLWYRANEMKQEGKFYEINQLSEWITSLQPSFPQVWAFNAWNMAYNISVATYTPHERWDWVNKGVKLLREKGIFYNPKSLLLYKELAWIFFHKIGQSSDDMHHFYKFQLALEWHMILGEPPVGAKTDQVIDWFRLTADAPTTIDELVAQHPEVGEILPLLEDIGFDTDHHLLTTLGHLRTFGLAQRCGNHRTRGYARKDAFLFQQALGCAEGIEAADQYPGVQQIQIQDWGNEPVFQFAQT